jgi:K(+)-stimulated pyrophosphate-energized sodium pump
MSVVALVIAPSIALSPDSLTAYSNEQMAKDVHREVRIEMEDTTGDMTRAVVTTTTTEGGKSATNKQVFEGTKEEVTSQLEGLEKNGTDVRVTDKKIIKVNETKKDGNNQ